MRPESFEVRHYEGADLALKEFAIAPLCLVRNAGMGCAELKLYLLLQSYNWLQNGERKNVVYPSQQTLADYMGFSKRHVRNLLQELERMKLIRIHSDEASNRNIYELLKLTERKVDTIRNSGEETGSSLPGVGNASSPYRGTTVPNPGGTTGAPKYINKKTDEDKHTPESEIPARALRGKSSPRDENDRFGKIKEPSPSPLPAKGTAKTKGRPMPSGSRQDGSDEPARKKKHSASSSDFTTWSTRAWVRFFTDQIAQATGEVPLPNWGRDQKMVQDILNEGIDKDALHAAMSWFAKNFGKLKGIKGTPGLPALRHYWPEIQKALKKRVQKQTAEAEDDLGWGKRMRTV